MYGSVVTFTALFLTLEENRNWTKGALAPGILSAVLIVPSSLCLSCLVAEQSQSGSDAPEAGRTLWLEQELRHLLGIFDDGVQVR